MMLKKNILTGIKKIFFIFIVTRRMFKTWASPTINGEFGGKNHANKHCCYWSWERR